MADWHEFWILSAALAIIALPGGLLCAAVWLLRPHSRHGLLPPSRTRAVPWLGIDVWVVLCIVTVVPLFIHELLQRVGLFVAVYGADEFDQVTRLRQLVLWSKNLALPIVLAMILFGLWSLRQTQLYQLGITGRRFGANLIVGYLAWLVLAPVTLAVNYGVNLLFEPQPHVLFLISKETLWRWEWLLLMVSALIAAPLTEELAFRGVLLPWLIRTPVVGHVMVALWTVAVAVLFSGDSEGSIKNWGPIVFVVCMLPGYGITAFLDQRTRMRTRGHGDPVSGWESDSNSIHATENAIQDSALRFRRLLAELFRLPQKPQRNVNLAIFGNALLFAAFHAGAWPSPIPLFFLSLGLAWIGYRTQSLVAPIVLHLLFNSIACLLLAFGPQT